ncbi:transcriptional regulator [Marine Group I thaumarchaeote]|uniref:Transcriptional regulator n=1 Tax=Marine Group I thaumarchaeote TaxID=2511932 RepID=A0A7K4M6R0_9ARCH|nr:MAG: transcriptional regulator [Nitrosopumilus sp. YT1]NMI81820.1 transcriptional regulator [Candidatus Nitrosopumilus sp. MTA1]NWJ19759.1 transcriptional regulator [Marine Group I thaumarchaeote]NWJ28154.1 transcriptional regulator [Marine Group I thaumarchaeote]NWJ56673.1 transcriptional regulator [Marine Group I thaumarchaeote]
MPEIWLNYGITDVVLDIRAENLEQKIDSEGKILEDSVINEKLNTLDLSKPMELVVLHNSKSIQKIISSLFTLCEQKSKPFPKILADKKILNLVKAGLPEGSSINEFDDVEISNSNLVFIAEMEFDGLFGYETISTRLIKKFGLESMLSAYAKRQGNLPTPGQYPESLEESKKFTNNFEIQGIEIVANSEGIIDFSIGHPSETLSETKIMESHSIKDIDHHKTMVISTGKDSSNDNLGKSLSSLWNCANAIKKDGLAILVAECKSGLGSDAIQQYIEGRLTLEQLENPIKYISGMEDLLFLSQVQKNFQICLVSILPEFYAKKLNMISLQGIKYSLDYILKTQGTKQKVVVVTDGARLLLR